MLHDDPHIRWSSSGVAPPDASGGDSCAMATRAPTRVKAPATIRRIWPHLLIRWIMRNIAHLAFNGKIDRRIAVRLQRSCEESRIRGFEGLLKTLWSSTSREPTARKFSAWFSWNLNAEA